MESNNKNNNKKQIFAFSLLTERREIEPHARTHTQTAQKERDRELIVQLLKHFSDFFSLCVYV